MENNFANDMIDKLEKCATRIEEYMKKFIIALSDHNQLR